jgi:hypothetical protein
VKANAFLTSNGKERCASKKVKSLMVCAYWCALCSSGDEKEACVVRDERIVYIVFALRACGCTTVVASRKQ